MVDKIRCACGLSQNMPWCDGSHQDETWFCEPKLQSSFNRAIYATAGLNNLSKRLAWRFEAQHLRYGEKATGKKLIVIDDGANLEQTHDAIADFNFDHILYVALDFDPKGIAHTLNIDQYHQVEGSLSDSFVQLEQQLTPWFETGQLPQTPKDTVANCQNIFISHAVADEALLLPAVASLRKLTGQEVFLCFDSIQSGGKWRRQIDTALQQSEQFVAIISKHSVKSTYCAYEIGFAAALAKPITLISIDGTLPPPFIGHIHCIDICREIAAKPWLDIPSALKLHLLNLG